MKARYKGPKRVVLGRPVPNILGFDFRFTTAIDSYFGGRYIPANTEVRVVRGGIKYFVVWQDKDGIERIAAEDV